MLLLNQKLTSLNFPLKDLHERSKKEREKHKGSNGGFGTPSFKSPRKDPDRKFDQIA